RKLEELRIVGHVHRRLAHPSLADARFDDGAQQRLRALDVLLARAEQVVVDEEDEVLLDQPQLLDDGLDRALAIAAAVERGDAAERAVERAAARGLDGAEPV